MGDHSMLIFGMLLTGSINTIAKRIQNDCKDKNGDLFSYPWTQTLFMFLGEVTLLFVFLYRRNKARSDLLKAGNTPVVNRSLTRGALDTHHYNPVYPAEAGGQPKMKHSSRAVIPGDAHVQVATKDLEQPLLGQEPKASPFEEKPSPFIFLIPTACDVLATTMGGIGLLYISASVWQMFRGSTIIFSAILSYAFIGKDIEKYHVVGIVIVTAGLLLVGASQLMQSPDSSSDDDNSNLVLGIIITLIGQFVASCQMIVEEKLLKGRELMPAQVVGSEGAWGVVLMLIILTVMYYVPGKSSGSYENSIVAIESVVHNTTLITTTLLYITSIAFYNYCGLSVARHLSTVHRTLIDALRTTVVWVVDLFIYYFISQRYGEEWNNYSYVQLGGFVLLLIGTLQYNNVIHLVK